MHINTRETAAGYWTEKPLMIAGHLLKPAMTAAESPMMKATMEGDTAEFASGSGILVLPIRGALTNRDYRWWLSYEVIHQWLDKAEAAPGIRGILLDVDSPGGDASGMLDLADRLYALRDTMPVWAVVNDAGFSAAYGLASAASKVFVSRTSGVGSVGVIAAHVDVSGMDKQQGWNFTFIQAGARKTDYNIHAPLSDTAETLLQAEVDRLYGLFTATVARNRGMTDAAVRKTEAGLFFGDKSVKAGLADAVVNPADVLPMLAEFITAPPTLSGSKGKKMSTTPKTVAIAAAEETTATDQTAVAAATDAASTKAVHPSADAAIIVELCAIAGKSIAEANGFIQAGLSADSVRAKLLAQKADEADQTVITSAVKPSTATVSAEQSAANDALLKAADRKAAKLSCAKK